jgi:hypothetical protein
MLFNRYGFPSSAMGGDVEAVQYIFTGNFVDLGAHQISVHPLFGNSALLF